MEEKAAMVFGNISMPPETARRIAQALEQKQNEEKGLHMRKITTFHKRAPLLPALLAAAVLICAGVFLAVRTAPLPQQAPTETTQSQEDADALQREDERLKKLQERHEKLTDGNLQNVIKRFETALDYTEGGNRYLFVRGGQNVTVDYKPDAHTPFTEYTDGRVYFTANGENLDITEDFSEEEPFTYIFTDRMFMEHYIAIGGTAENPGWLEMIYTSWEEKPYSFVTGTGINTWNNAADERYGWEPRAQEIFEPYGVHWPS